MATVGVKGLTYLIVHRKCNQDAAKLSPLIYSSSVGFNILVDTL